MGTKTVRGKPRQLALPAKGRNVYLTEDMHEWLAAKADAAQMSVSSQIRTILLAAMRAETGVERHA